MMSNNWVIVDNTDKIIEQRLTPDGVHPKDDGFPWDDAQHRAFKTAHHELVTYDFDVATQTWTMNAAQCEKVSLAEIDAARDSKRGVYGRDYVYAQKQNEINSLKTAGDNPDLSKFPYASAEMAITGETITTVMARWQTAIDKTNAMLAQVEAISVTAKADVKAASEADEKSIIVENTTISLAAIDEGA